MKYKILKLKSIKEDISKLFSYIIYVPHTYSENLIIENCHENRTFLVDHRNINKYIQISNFETDWEVDYFGNLIKINESQIIQIFDLTKEIQFLNIELYLNKIKLHDFVSFKDSHFSLISRKKKLRRLLKKDKKRYKIIIKCRVPVFPIICQITKNKRIDILYIDKIFLNINNKIYSFPYGNVSNQDNICLNGYKNIETPQHIFSKVFFTKFNDDYDLRLKYSELIDENQSIADQLKFSEISEKINFGSQVNLIQLLYYLSHFDESNIRELPVEKIFLRAIRGNWMKVYLERQKEIVGYEYI